MPSTNFKSYNSILYFDKDETLNFGEGRIVNTTFQRANLEEHEQLRTRNTFQFIGLDITNDECTICIRRKRRITRTPYYYDRIAIDLAYVQYCECTENYTDDKNDNTKKNNKNHAHSKKDVSISISLKKFMKYRNRLHVSHLHTKK